ncbi:uncharacterized protein BX663DRAFT_133377 [Cokeromyces recurvatus]|uniref:uncharacterized protein n=1 Tax=Cokeromyces recurvatus TaxID=90255 RepID=UPI00221F51E5|nr:uncharacterized protein BX663DRAFT_133377 [Cokeromyces recurvatus]KAI7907272.1 hypothetical protein BX663DRAFT_133377 [Cokeromyces recurvatus]
MKFFCLNCTVEHPSHSLILDTADKCWETVFNEKDLKEIKTYNLKPLASLPSKMEECIDSLKHITDLDELYKTLKQQELQPLKESQLEWLQSSLYNAVKLFMFNYFPLTDQSESDILKRLVVFY